MIVLKVTMMEGRTLEQKRTLARRLTEAAARHFGEPAEEIRLVIYEVTPNQWASGGQLMGDKEPR